MCLANESLPLFTQIPKIDFTKTDEEVFGRNPNFFTPKADGSHEMNLITGPTPVSSVTMTPVTWVGPSPWQKDDAQREYAVLFLALSYGLFVVMSERFFHLICITSYYINL